MRDPIGSCKIVISGAPSLAVARRAAEQPFDVVITPAHICFLDIAFGGQWVSAQVQRFVGKREITVDEAAGVVSIALEGISHQWAPAPRRGD